MTKMDLHDWEKQEAFWRVRSLENSVFFPIISQSQASKIKIKADDSMLFLLVSLKIFLGNSPSV